MTAFTTFRITKQPTSATLMGLIGGVVCYLAASKVKAKFGYDDSLDAFGVHGVGGTLGALLTGIFASKDVNPAIAQLYKPDGKTAVDLSGGGAQFFNQLIAVGITWAMALFTSFDAKMPVRSAPSVPPTPWTPNASSESS